MGHAKDSPEPGRGVPEASGARGGRAEPLEKALGMTNIGTTVLVVALTN